MCVCLFVFKYWEEWESEEGKEGVRRRFPFYRRRKCLVSLQTFLLYTLKLSFKKKNPIFLSFFLSTLFLRFAFLFFSLCFSFLFPSPPYYLFKKGERERERKSTFLSFFFSFFLFLSLAIASLLWLNISLMWRWFSFYDFPNGGFGFN